MREFLFWLDEKMNDPFSTNGYIFLYSTTKNFSENLLREQKIVVEEMIKL